MISYKEYYMQLLTEMPAVISANGYSSATKRDAFINSKITKDKDASEVSTFNTLGLTIKVKEKYVTDQWLRLFFYDKNDKLAFYSGYVSDNKIVTQIIEAKKNAVPGKSLMAHIYKDYLLNRFKYVISDSGLTASGFHFWKNNFDFFKKYNIKMGICKLKDQVSFGMENIKYLESSVELDKYYGNKDIRYFLTKQTS